MFRKLIIAVAAVVWMVSVLPAVAGAGKGLPGPDLVEELEAWLDINSGLPRVPGPPSIRLIQPWQVPPSTGNAASIGRHTRGVYLPETSEIELVRPWDVANPQDVAVLLHELLHRRQFAGPARCPGALEHAAYRAEEKWLAERGQILDVNWTALALGAGCFLHDVHP